MYLLFALAAGLVGCFHINRLYKLSEGVWREFCERGVSAYSLNKLFNVFYLSFLYFDFFLQIHDFNFKLHLLVLVGLAHHGKTLVAQIALGVVLVDFDKQAVKLPYTLFCLCQTLLIYLYGFLALQAEPLLHLHAKMRFISAHERDNFFYVFPDQILQNDGSDVMTSALVLVGSVRGADKKVLPLFKIVSGGIVELLSAIGADHRTRKRTALARSRSPMSLLSDFLYLVKDFLFNNRRMGVVENLLIFFGILSLLLIPNGVGVGFEVDSSTDILFTFKNIDDGAFVPAVRILRLGVWCLYTLLSFVCGGREYLFTFKLFCDLARSSSVHAERENLFDYLCRFFVDDPLGYILRIFAIHIRNIYTS